VFFYALTKGSISASDTIDWSQKMSGSVEKIAAENPNFKAYIAGETEHCIINRPSFYTQTVGGRKFSDWVTSLVAGTDPGQVR
jgi:hypothetical protein